MYQISVYSSFDGNLLSLATVYCFQYFRKIIQYVVFVTVHVNINLSWLKVDYIGVLLKLSNPDIVFWLLMAVARWVWFSSKVHLKRSSSACNRSGSFLASILIFAHLWWVIFFTCNILEKAMIPNSKFLIYFNHVCNTVRLQRLTSDCSFTMVS